MSKANTTQSQRIDKLEYEFLQTRIAIGKTKTMQVLRNARHTEQNMKCNSNVQNVLEQVSNNTGISVKEIVFSIKRDDNLKIARCLTVYFLIEILKLNNVAIAKLLNKTKQMVGKYHGLFLSCKLEKPKADFDKKISTHYYKILPLINKEAKPKS